MGTDFWGLNVVNWHLFHKAQAGFLLSVRGDVIAWFTAETKTMWSPIGWKCLNCAAVGNKRS